MKTISLFQTIFFFCFLTVICSSPKSFAIDRKTELNLTQHERDLLLRAHMAKTLKKYDRAEKAYQKLLDHSPSLIDIQRELAELYIEQKKWKEAADGYREVLFLDPDDVESRFQFAQILLWDKQFEKAERELLGLSETHPDEEEILEKLIDLYLEKENWQKALALLDRLIAVNPYSRTLRMQRGRVLTWSLQYDLAIGAFNNVLEISPGDYEARKELAYIYGWKKEWVEAETRLGELIEENPSDMDLQKELGEIYFYQNKYDAANEIYSQIITYNPQSSQQLSGRLSELRAVSAPVLSANYFYFYEKDQDAGTSSDNHQWLVDYAWPLNDKFKGTIISGYRFDSVTKNTPIFGAAVQFELFPRVFIEPRVTVEPNKKINPRHKYRLTVGHTFNPSFEIQLYDEYTKLWNDNRANSVALFITMRPLADKTFRVRNATIYDWIHAPSDFFIRVDKPEGARLDKWSNSTTFEKDIKINEGFTVTPGYTFGYDQTATKSQTVFGSMTLSGPRYSFISSVSYGWDSDNFIYKSIGSYFSWRF